VSAPIDDDILAVAGLLLVEAVSMWARSPFDVVLTFVENSDGPPWHDDEASI